MNENHPFVLELIIPPPGSCEYTCDVCRRPLVEGDGYHQVTLGMDEAPSHVGACPTEESAVEMTSELLVCSRCEPAVSKLFDGLLTALWELRAADPPVAPAPTALQTDGSETQQPAQPEILDAVAPTERSA